MPLTKLSTTAQAVLASAAATADHVVTLPKRLPIAAQRAVVKSMLTEVRTRGEKSPNIGYNANTREYVDMFKAGIVDPTRVTRSALTNAASIAGLMLTTEVMITKVDEETTPVPGPSSTTVAVGSTGATDASRSHRARPLGATAPITPGLRTAEDTNVRRSRAAVTTGDSQVRGGGTTRDVVRHDLTGDR